MKSTFSSFSTRTATLATVSVRTTAPRHVLTRTAMVELFGAELYGQRRF